MRTGCGLRVVLNGEDRTPRRFEGLDCVVVQVDPGDAAVLGQRLPVDGEPMVLGRNGYRSVIQILNRLIAAVK